MTTTMTTPMTRQEILEALEEVDSLVAYIEDHPELPYAHLAPKQAALARQDLETKLVALDAALDGASASAAMAAPDASAVSASESAPDATAGTASA